VGSEPFLLGAVKWGSRRPQRWPAWATRIGLSQKSNDCCGNTSPMSDARSAYPGDLATPEEVLRLAECYRQAALALARLGTRGDPASHAPYRNAAIHAIELYLNALLLRAGHPPSLIRGLRHDFSARADMAITCGLRFRRRTAAHLRMIASTREHLVTRYGPELTSTLTQLNRLAATLDEIATKVHFAMSKAASTASPRIECAGPGSEPRANKVTKS
jgi:hypothetical protein